MSLLLRVMSNRVLIHIASGTQMIPQDARQERLFDKLSTTPSYMWQGDRVEVTATEAVRILEAERQSLVEERAQLEKEKAAFYAERIATNIEQPVKRRTRQTK